MLIFLSCLFLGQFLVGVIAQGDYYYANAEQPAIEETEEAPKRFFNITALSGENGRSVIQCWQLTEPFRASSQAGTAGIALQQLGQVNNTDFLVLPPKFDGGLHNAPAVQYVAFLSGLAHVTLPDSREDAWIYGGKYGLILAADTAEVSEVGHYTEYPTRQPTTALQIPTADGKLPEHRVLHGGPCRRKELDY